MPRQHKLYNLTPAKIKGFFDFLLCHPHPCQLTMKRISPNNIQPTILVQRSRHLTSNHQELAIFLEIFCDNYPLALLHHHPDFRGLRHVLRQFVLNDDPIIEPFLTPVFDGNISLGHEPNWKAFIYQQWSHQLSLWAFERLHAHINRFFPEPANCLHLTPTMIQRRIIHECKNLIAYYFVKENQATDEDDADFWKNKQHHAMTRAEIRFHDEPQLRTLKEQYEDPMYTDRYLTEPPY